MLRKWAAMLRKSATQMLMATVFVAFLGVLPVLAQDNKSVDEMSADTLIEEHVAVLKDYIDDHQSFSTEGEWLVEDVGPYHAITFPALYIDLPTGRIDLGILAANVTGHPESNNIKGSLALPTEIAYLTPNKNVETVLTIDRQQNSFVWGHTPDMNTGLLELSLENTIIEDSDWAAPLKAAVLNLELEHGVKADKRAFSASGQNLSMGLEGGGDQDFFTLHLENFTLYQTMEGRAPHHFLGDFISGTDRSLQNVSATASLNNLILDAPAFKNPLEIEALAMERTYKINEEGRVSGGSTLTLTSDANPTGDNPRSAFWPTSVEMDFSYQNISTAGLEPFMPLNYFSGNYFSGNYFSGLDQVENQNNINQILNQEKGLIEQMKMMLRPAMKENQPTGDAGIIKVDNSRIAFAGGASISTYGELRGTENGAVTGGLTVDISGLSNLREQVNGKSKDAAETVAKGSPVAVPGALLMLGAEMFGEKVVTPAGEVIVRFNLSLDQDRGLLLNDQSLQVITNLIKTGSAAAKLMQPTQPSNNEQ